MIGEFMNELKIKLKFRGFTLVELLTVIIILGILSVIVISSLRGLIEKSRKENLESSRNTLIMATKSYMQDNTESLPKDIGSVVEVGAKTLRKNNYLKEDIVNSFGKSCMEKSIVRVYKYDKSNYNYTAYVYCDGDNNLDDLDVYNPIISASFTDKNGNVYDAAKVKSAVVNITFDGNKNQLGKQIGLDGYSYIISVKYDDRDSLLEVYNSGSLSARGRSDLTVTKDITNFIDITKTSYIKVIAQVYNSEGGFTRQEFSSSYDDNIIPLCGKTTNEPEEDEWDNSLRKRTITIKCSDGDGSGCVRGTYTKTFNKEAEYGIIKIKDNAGNENQCKVRVHLDWTEPTLTINAYKLQANGAIGDKVASVTANSKNKEATLDKYLDGYGSDSWLNKSKYPYGVYYEIVTSGNVKLDTGTWSENKKGLVKKARDVKTFTKKDKATFKSNTPLHYTLVDEGFRYAKYVLKDKADNTATVNITAPIDRTNPTKPTIKLYKKTSATDVKSSKNLSGYTNDSWLKGWVYTEASKSTDTMSGFDHYEYTTSGAVSNKQNVKAAYLNINPEGVSYVKYRACDVAGNCTSYGDNNTIKLDRSGPSCGTVSGSSTTWTNQNRTISVACSDSYSGCSKNVFSNEFNTDVKVGEMSLSDKLGNVTKCPVNVYLDKTKPTLTAKFTKEGGGSYSSGSLSDVPVTRTLTPKDNLSGIYETQYNTGSGWVKETKLSNYKYTAEVVNQNIKFRTIDNAGNVSSELSYKVRIEQNIDKNYKITCKTTCDGACLTGSSYWNDQQWTWYLKEAKSGINRSTLGLDYSTDYVNNYCLWNVNNAPYGNRSGCGYAIFNTDSIVFSRSYACSSIVGRACTNKGVCAQCVITERSHC